MKYTFSVIIPIYNLDKYIKEAIESIVNQTIGFEENIQIILVDDGSTDFSSNICKKYVTRYPENIKYVYQENQGASAARNTGIELAEGKYIALFDGDDIWSKDAFEKVYAYFEENYDEIDVVACRIIKFEKESGYTNLDYRFDAGTRIIDIHKDPWAIHPNVTSSFFKASAIKNHRFDTKLLFGEDAKFLAVLIAQNGKYGLLKEVLYYYRKRSEQDSLTQSANNDVARHLITSEYYYKGLYQYSIDTYGKVLPFFQHLIMNALRFRVTQPVPQGLTPEQAEQYRSNIKWVINHTNEMVIIRLKKVLKNTKMYLLWLKFGDAIFDKTEFKNGQLFYKKWKIGTKVEKRGIMRIDDVEILGNHKKYYGAIQLSIFLPEPELFADFGEGPIPIKLNKAVERSRKSFLETPLHQVYTWEIQTHKELDFPVCSIRLDDFETTLIPTIPNYEEMDLGEKNEIHKDEYVRKVAEITDEKYAAVLKNMEHIEKYAHVDFEDYYKYRLYNQTEPQRMRICRKLVRQYNFRRECYDKITLETGLTEAQVDAYIEYVNRRNIYKISLGPVAKFELYKYKGKELDKKLVMLARRNYLKKKLKTSFELIDAGKMSYTDIKKDIDEIYNIYEQLIPESLLEKYAEKLKFSFPDLVSDMKKIRHIAADIEFSNFVLGFYVTEYVAFRFADKALDEKRKFISETELIKIYQEIHNDVAYDILNDKKRTFDLLGYYYKRNVIKITGENDKEIFLRFCENKDYFVFKPVFGAMGRGVSLVRIADYNSPEQIFQEFTNQYGVWVAEDRIEQHEHMKQLNQDSVNTIRLITYFDGKKTTVHRVFAKVGREGSFVDNGGAGGILVSVNPKTGIFNSDGCDENGVMYKAHPESEVIFKGFKLPKWRKAIRLGKKIANKIEGACYIGWDLAYTADKKWVVVEGNSRTQFIGQQCTTGKGEKKQFLNLIYK